MIAVSRICLGAGLAGGRRGGQGRPRGLGGDVSFHEDQYTRGVGATTAPPAPGQGHHQRADTASPSADTRRPPRYNPSVKPSRDKIQC